jgi:hypothetical protein
VIACYSPVVVVVAVVVVGVGVVVSKLATIIFLAQNNFFAGAPIPMPPSPTLPHGEAFKSHFPARKFQEGSLYPSLNQLQSRTAGHILIEKYFTLTVLPWFALF